MTIDGFIILTDQPDGSWQPDWDGIYHTEDSARAALDAACAALGEGAARIVACTRWEDA